MSPQEIEKEVKGIIVIVKLGTERGAYSLVMYIRVTNNSAKAGKM